MAGAENLEKQLLAAINSAPGGVVSDTAPLAAELGCDHKALVGCMKSLLSSDMILAEVRQTPRSPCPS